jgi:hypothetical protein
MRLTLNEKIFMKLKDVIYSESSLALKIFDINLIQFIVLVSI